MAKNTESKPDKGPKKTQAKADVAKTEVVQSLRVEINFPSITDLKQALAFDADGNLLIRVQFTSRVDQYEIFRLVNLLKQPHGSLFATIGSPQTAMDFKFGKDGRVEIVKALVQAEKAKTPALDKPTATQEPDQAKPASAIHSVGFNHIPEEEKPFGVLIEYVVNGTGEIRTVAGRGKTPTEAVISGVKHCGAVAQELSEPFEIRAALEGLEPSPEGYKLIRVLDIGSFDIQDKGDNEPGKGE